MLSRFFTSSRFASPQPSTATEECVAWVVFSDHAASFWSQGLKRGFRHCFILAKNNSGECAHVGWQMYDPFYRACGVPLPSDFDVVQWLRNQQNQGMTIIPTAHLPQNILVRIVLRLLTPWRFYQVLTFCAERKAPRLGLFGKACHGGQACAA